MYFCNIHFKCRPMRVACLPPAACQTLQFCPYGKVSLNCFRTFWRYSSFPLQCRALLCRHTLCVEFIALNELLHLSRRKFLVRLLNCLIAATRVDVAEGTVRHLLKRFCDASQSSGPAETLVWHERPCQTRPRALGVQRGSPHCSPFQS
jgi:hypothetical protein